MAAFSPVLVRYAASNWRFLILNCVLRAERWTTPARVFRIKHANARTARLLYETHPAEYNEIRLFVAERYHFRTAFNAAALQQCDITKYNFILRRKLANDYGIEYTYAATTYVLRARYTQAINAKQSSPFKEMPWHERNAEAPKQSHFYFVCNCARNFPIGWQQAINEYQNANRSAYKDVWATITTCVRALSVCGAIYCSKTHLCDSNNNNDNSNQSNSKNERELTTDGMEAY